MITIQATYHQIDEKYIATEITLDDLTKVSRQLDRSMGEVFGIIKVFAVVLFAVLMFLLTKLIVEKNSTSISMVKILGYSNSEISRLYVTSTTIVVVISVVINEQAIHNYKACSGYLWRKCPAGFPATMHHICS